MIVPVRCISCGKVIADKWEQYTKEVSAGKAPKKILDELGIKRYCCRAVFMTSVNLIDEVAKFKRRSIPIAEEPKIEEVSEIEKSIAEKAAMADVQKTESATDEPEKEE